MGRHREGSTRQVRLSMGRVAAAVPAAVLVAAGLTAAAAPSESPATEEPAAPAAEQQALPQVPERAVDEPASATAADGRAPALTLPPPVSADGAPGSARVALDTAAIPARALQAYRHAERLLAAADPQCRLSWSLVAAIGKVESDHGRFGGNALDTEGVARPGIYGIPLDGRPGVAAIADTDGGRWDRDTTWDRAVGPMQFIPGTWRTVAADAEPDGIRDPQDIDDAAAAAGVYLCSGPGDLSTATDAYRAVHRYNRSDAYVRTVLSIADAYARGVREVSAASLPAAAVAPAPAAPLPAAPPAPEPTAPAPAPAPAEPAPSSSSSSAPPSPPPAEQPRDSGGSVPDVVADVVGGVLPSAPFPTSPSSPAPVEPLVRLLVATLPGDDERCVDEDDEPVALALGLCPVGAFLAPGP